MDTNSLRNHRRESFRVHLACKPSISLWVRWVPIAAGTLGVVLLSLFFVNQPNTETLQAYREYVREREQLELPRVRVSQDTSSLELRTAYPQPFHRP